MEGKFANIILAITTLSLFYFSIFYFRVDQRGSSFNVNFSFRLDEDHFLAPFPSYFSSSIDAFLLPAEFRIVLQHPTAAR